QFVPAPPGGEWRVVVVYAGHRAALWVVGSHTVPACLVRTRQTLGPHSVPGRRWLHGPGAGWVRLARPSANQGAAGGTARARCWLPGTASMSESVAAAWARSGAAPIPSWNAPWR